MVVRTGGPDSRRRFHAEHKNFLPRIRGRRIGRSVRRVDHHRWRYRRWRPDLLRELRFFEQRRHPARVERLELEPRHGDGRVRTADVQRAPGLLHGDRDGRATNLHRPHGHLPGARGELLRPRELPEWPSVLRYICRIWGWGVRQGSWSGRRKHDSVRGPVHGRRSGLQLELGLSERRAVHVPGGHPDLPTGTGGSGCRRSPGL
jgi:hypothetical protein